MTVHEDPEQVVFTREDASLLGQCAQVIAWVIDLVWGEAHRRGLSLTFAEVERAVEAQRA